MRTKKKKCLPLRSLGDFLAIRVISLTEMLPEETPKQHICSSMPWHTAQLLAGSRRMSKELRRGLIYLSLIENTLNGQHEKSSFGCCRNAVSKHDKHVMLCCPLLAKSWNPYMKERPVKICVNCGPISLWGKSAKAAADIRAHRLWPLCRLSWNAPATLGTNGVPTFLRFLHHQLTSVSSPHIDAILHCIPTFADEEIATPSWFHNYCLIEIPLLPATWRSQLWTPKNGWLNMSLHMGPNYTSPKNGCIHSI